MNRPSYPRLQRHHPIGKDVVWACGQGRVNDLAGGGIATVEANHDIGRPTFIGPSIYKNTANNSNACYWSHVNRLRTIKRHCTMVVWARITSLASSYTTLLSMPYRTDGSWSTPFRAMGFTGPSGNTHGQYQYAENSSTNHSVDSSGGYYAADGILRCYAVVRKGANVVFWRDRAAYSTATLGTDVAVDWNATEVNLGSSSQSANISNSPQAFYPLAFVVNRAMSRNEMLAHYADPWAMFRAEDEGLLSTRAAAVPSATAPSLALTGVGA